MTVPFRGGAGETVAREGYVQVKFYILGPLMVHAGSGPVHLGEPRLRRILAVMLLNSNTVVPADYLIDAVWDDHPPSTARRQLQNCVSALRGRFAEDGADVLVTDGPGYRLQLTPGSLDAQVFSDQVAGARRRIAEHQWEAAVTGLRSALKIWRGSALAGLSGRAIEAAAAGLEEQRIAATEDCIDLELQQRRHRELIGELTMLVSAHPSRERLTGQLMLALSRSGRQREALDVYHQLRTLLADELGLSPGAQVQDIYQSILAGVPTGAGIAAGEHSTVEPGPTANAPTRPAPAQLPGDVAAFAGRADHLKALNELLPTNSGDNTTTGICVITGMAGVGKSALALHWAHQVADLFPDGQLYVNLRGFAPAGSAMVPAEAVRGFLDAFGVPAGQIPVSTDAQVGLYRSLLAGRRVLLVLDNARDSDQVRPLLPGAPGCMTLVTSRNRLSGLVATGAARPLTLEVMSHTEAQRMLASRLGLERTATEPAAVDEIIARCAGLPLALAIVAARAATNPRFTLHAVAAELRADRLDLFAGGDAVTDLRAVFSWSYLQLSGEAARLFRLLGPAPGRDVATRAVATIAGLPPDQARPLLAELTRMQMIAEPTPGRFEMHDLLRAYATELALTHESPQSRRAAMRRMLDHCLHSALAADHHLDPHRDPIPIDVAGPGVTAERVDDHEQAMAWLDAQLPTLVAAIERAAEDGFHRHCWQLAWALAHFFERRAHWHQWIAVQRIALASARHLSDLLGQAHGHRSAGRANIHLDHVDEARTHLTRALELFRELDDPAGQARIHFDLGWLAGRQGRKQDLLEHSEQALDLFRAAGHRSGQSRALNNVGWGHLSLGDYEQAVAHGNQALALQKQIGGDPWAEADTWDLVGHAHGLLGHHQQAADCYERALRLYRMLGDRYHQAELRASLGDTYHAVGDTASARVAWQQALDAFGEFGHPDAERVRARLEQLEDPASHSDHRRK